jgi:catechol 2,3-dioxygenase-like lactoylglutathione lyase family enzyme
MSRDDEFEPNMNCVGPIHHTAVKTRNITMAIKFYSLFGFEPTSKFKAGPARAAWLDQQSASPTTIDATINSTAASSTSSSRIELIEVPPWILKEPVGMTRRAIDLFENQEYLGHNHLALDVTSSIDANKTELESSLLLRNHTFLLSAWMETLNEKSLQLFQKTVRVALEAEQFMVGNVVYERAFIYDADGALIELLHRAAELPQQIDPMSGWELYDWFEDGNETDARNDDTVGFSNN